ncbi:MAG: sulfurtransferase [Pseudomonadota bacterium]
MGSLPLSGKTGTSPFVISAADLNDRLGEPNLRVVDASFYLPAMGRDAEAEFLEAHIPGAVRFDIDDIAAEDPRPHTLADANSFGAKVGALGISQDDVVVVYDGIGLFSAPRVWLNFREMGSKEVLILDGGFRAWTEAGFETETGPASPTPVEFKARQTNIAADMNDVADALADGSATVVDARPLARFTGEDPEPRAGMRSGHMPGAVSLPLTDLIDKGRLKPVEQLEALLAERGIFPNDPVITSCGSGVTAAAIDLALRSVGHSGPIRLYDGSWSEWGARSDTAVATGLEEPGIPVRITYLQMDRRPALSLGRPHGINVSLLSVHQIPLAYYRYLQREVGDPWHWVNRRRLSDAALAEIVHAQTTEISVLYLDGSPAGFFEIDRSDVGSPEIAFFGLMPRATGLKLGRWFLAQAIEAAWSEGEPSSIRVETCTADHPAALPLYQKMGFSPVGMEESKVFPLKPHEIAI